MLNDICRQTIEDTNELHTKFIYKDMSQRYKY